MPNKSFSIFNGETDGIDDRSHCLYIEIAKSHLAAIAIPDKSKTISAFELFTYKDYEYENFERLYSSILTNSKLLRQTFLETNVFINHEYCIPVPRAYFTDKNATDFLQLAFGPQDDVTIHHDHLFGDLDLVNVYSAPKQYSVVYNASSNDISLHHTWTNVLKNRASETTGGIEWIEVQFYNTFFIAVLRKEGQLQLIQTFVYETPEDVLYHLLNISERFSLNRGELLIEISGMVDLQYKLYREMKHYFKNIEVRKVHKDNWSPELNEYPAHYFTPFFNLTL